MTVHSQTSSLGLAGAARRRLYIVVGIVVLILVLTNLTVGAKPFPAQRYSMALSLVGSETGFWESEPIQIDVTVAGLSWEGVAPSSGWVRASVDGVEWGPWVELAIAAEHGPDPTSSEHANQSSASEPLYLDAVEWVQYRIQTVSPNDVKAEMIETEGRQLGLMSRIGHWFESVAWGSDTADAAPNQPTIVPREAWGGDSCVPNSDPRYTPAVRMMFVHHTTTYNSYPQEDVPGIIYAMCTYHVQTRGWKDLGYNFVIDRFGTIYEARDGGIENAVWGAHTGGFNYYSFGVGLIGDFDFVAPSQPMLDALEELATWKLDLHHVDPTATAEVESLGSSKYATGVVVTLNTVSGHRDASVTSCPGHVCYPLLPGLRPLIYSHGGAKIFGGIPEVLPPAVTEDVEIPFSFTEAMDWDFRLLTESGIVISESSGSGISDVGTWDGKIDGQPAARGLYTIEIDAVTQDDGEVPTPVRAELEWYEPPFSDDDFNLHEGNIGLIADDGITQGCSSIFLHLYCPDNKVGRDQMASFIARALDLRPATSDYFTDDNGNAHEASINALAQAGITVGCENGLYCPSDTVRRDHMAAFIARALGLSEVAEDFFDDDNGSFEADINAIATAGITLGCGERNYCPADVVGRDQMASFLARAFLDSGA